MECLPRGLNKCFGLKFQRIALGECRIIQRNVMNRTIKMMPTVRAMQTVQLPHLRNIDRQRKLLDVNVLLIFERVTANDVKAVEMGLLRHSDVY